MVNGNAKHRAHALLCCVNCILCSAVATTAIVVVVPDDSRSLNQSDFIGIKFNFGRKWNDKSPSSFEFRVAFAYLDLISAI